MDIKNKRDSSGKKVDQLHSVSNWDINLSARRLLLLAVNIHSMTMYRVLSERPLV